MVAQALTIGSEISRLNNVLLDDTAIRLLDDETEPLVASLVREVQAAIDSLVIPFEEIEIYGFDDPEGGRDQIIVILWVNLSIDESLALWSTMSRYIQKWRHKLTLAEQRIVLNLIAFEVRWRTDASAA